MRLGRYFLVGGLLWIVAFGAVAAEQKSANDKKPENPPEVTDSVEQVVAKAVESVVIVRFTGREGTQQGLGSGFILSEDGLIATNLHVLGEARPISVELADGRTFEVTSIHASDKSQDLAVIKIEAQGLKPLPLGDSDQLKQGQSVIAIGNPLGLTHSVVRGLLSATRDEEPKLQLSMPVVPGNSGGPVLDFEGKVHGIIAQRSLREANVGYAVTINALKPLLEKPNSIPMSSWLTIGALDAADWKPLFGAQWRQRAGRIKVEGMGSGFGGRSLCLWQQPVPQMPFEMAVSVRLENEAGAAGLVFHSDGDQRHYGFYPSAGSMRLSRFDGPDVFSWKVLEQVDTPHYRPGEWNRLKVRIEADRVLCYVNGQLVIESTDRELIGEKVGLAKFRDTHAEFKRFAVGATVPDESVDPQVVKTIRENIDSLLDKDREQLTEKLSIHADAALSVLESEAKELELRAKRLREMAQEVHETRVRQELKKVLAADEQEVDLLRACLLLAWLDNPEVDVAAYAEEVDRMAEEIRSRIKKDADPANRLQALNDYLFKERGFHGSRTDYYNRANSYLNEVIDDREGLPITLSVLYIELAQRLGLRVVGVPLPGHFVVRFEPEEGSPQLIDVFEQGETLTLAEAQQKVLLQLGRPAEDHHFEATTPAAIIKRMLFNLLGVAEREADHQAMLRYLELLVDLDPQSGPERWMRAVLRLQLDRREQARQDADWLLEHKPDGVDLDRVRHLRQLLDQ